MAKKNDTTFFENKLLDFVTAKDPMLEILILLYNILYTKKIKKGITKMADENKNLTPVWIAYVDGKRLSTDYEGALRKIYINDRLDFIGTASLLFDISAVDFDNDDIFVLGSEVSIHLGYKDDVEEVLFCQ